jgi:hypothetical protein
MLPAHLLNSHVKPSHLTDPYHPAALLLLLFLALQAAGVPPKVEAMLTQLVEGAGLSALVAAGKPDPGRLAALVKARAALNHKQQQQQQQQQQKQKQKQGKGAAAAAKGSQQQQQQAGVKAKGVKKQNQPLKQPQQQQPGAKQPQHGGGGSKQQQQGGRQPGKRPQQDAGGGGSGGKTKKAKNSSA